MKHNHNMPYVRCSLMASTSIPPFKEGPFCVERGKGLERAGLGGAPMSSLSLSSQVVVQRIGSWDRSENRSPRPGEPYHPSDSGSVVSPGPAPTNPPDLENVVSPQPAYRRLRRDSSPLWLHAERRRPVIGLRHRELGLGVE